MSVKSIGFKSVSLTPGTYTTPSITVNRAGQITEIISQVIAADDTNQVAYDALETTVDEITAELSTIKTDLATAENNLPTGLTTNESLYFSLEDQYAVVKSEYDSINKEGITTNSIVYSLAQQDFNTGTYETDYVNLNPTTITLSQGLYNIDFNFIAIGQQQDNKENEYFFRVSNNDLAVKGPCQSAQYATWNNNDTQFIAFNGSMVFQVASGVETFNLLVPRLSGGNAMDYKPPDPLPIGTYTELPTSGDYSGIPTLEVSQSPNSIVITALRYAL
jgi:hypothetical protein